MSKTALILKSEVGTETFYESTPNILADSNFTYGHVDKAQESYYVVYSGPKYQEGNSNDSVLVNGYRIVENTSYESLGFVARSARGIDMTGCALFEYMYYSGQGHNFRISCPDLSRFFTTTGEGISSVIISRGTWAFFTEKHYQGTMITINKQNKFRPGFRLDCIGAIKVMSIQLLQD